MGRTPRDKYMGKLSLISTLSKYGDNILRPIDYEREYVQRLLPTLEEPKPLEEVAVEEPVSNTEETEKPANETAEQPETENEHRTGRSAREHGVNRLTIRIMPCGKHLIPRKGDIPDDG